MDKLTTLMIINNRYYYFFDTRKLSIRVPTGSISPIYLKEKEGRLYNILYI